MNTKSKYMMKAFLLVVVGFMASGGMAGEKFPEIKQDDRDLERNGPVLTSFAPIIRDVRQSVVSIETEQKVNMQTTRMIPDPLFAPFFGIPEQVEPRRAPVQMGLGSGVIVSENGYILTNNHVIDGADKIVIELTHNRKKYEARLVGADPGTDVAVLKIDAENLPSATFADSEKLQVGDIVMAIGNPLGVGQSVTMGIVGATGRADLSDLQIDYQSFIQTDAAINRGNSGGALVDAYGRLIGINTAIASPSGGSDGLGFAIPSNLAKTVMKNLIEHGKMVRGYLGVLIQDVTSEVSEYFGLDSAKGAFISQVMEDSPADRAGMKEGDIVISVNGFGVNSKDDFRSRIAQTAPGEKVALKISREGKEMVLYPILDELDENSMTSTGSRSGNFFGNRRNTIDDSALEGLRLDVVDSRYRREFNIPGNIQGLVITGIDSDSRFVRSRLNVGDIISSVHQIPVRTMNDLEKALNSKGSNQILLKVHPAQSGYRASQYVVVKK